MQSREVKNWEEDQKQAEEEYDEYAEEDGPRPNIPKPDDLCNIRDLSPELMECRNKPLDVRININRNSRAVKPKDLRFLESWSRSYGFDTDVPLIRERLGDALSHCNKTANAHIETHAKVTDKHEEVSRRASWGSMRDSDDGGALNPIGNGLFWTMHEDDGEKKLNEYENELARARAGKRPKVKALASNLGSEFGSAFGKLGPQESRSDLTAGFGHLYRASSNESALPDTFSSLFSTKGPWQEDPILESTQLLHRDMPGPSVPARPFGRWLTLRSA